MNLQQIENLALELMNLDTLDINDKRLTLKDDSTNVTVAHAMAAKGYTFPLESELLKLVDDQGWTVAHVMADEGYQFPKGSELLKLVSKDIKGYEDDF